MGSKLFINTTNTLTVAIRPTATTTTATGTTICTTTTTTSTNICTTTTIIVCGWLTIYMFQ